MKIFLKRIALSIFLLLGGALTIVPIQSTTAQSFGSVVATTTNNKVQSYEDEYRAILLRAAVLGYQAPGSLIKQKQNQLVINLKRGGAGWAQTTSLWDDHDILYVPANDVSSSFWKLNWINPATFEITEIGGSLNKNSSGVAGSGSEVANTHFQPLSHLTVGDATDLGIYAWTTSFTGGLFGVEDNVNNRIRLLTGDYAVNSVRSTPTPDLSSGLWHIYGGSSSQFKFNNTQQNSFGSRVVGTLTDRPMYFCGANNNGSAVGSTSRISVFGLGESMALRTVPLFSCYDEYFNGEWPINKVVTRDITPTPIGSLDYNAFPEIIQDDLGRYQIIYSEASAHGVSAPGYITKVYTSDRGATLSSPVRLVSSGYTKTLTIQGGGPGNTGIVTIDGFTYGATYNTSLSITAANFVSTHAATLLSRGYVVINPSGAIIHVQSQDETEDIPMTWDNSGGLGAQVAYNFARGDQALGKTASGRLLLLYTAVSGQVRIPMLKYSDDDGDNWSASQQYITYFGSVGQGAGPGNAITLDNGDMLKAEYGTVEDRAANPSATRTIYIFKCLAADNGLVWNYLSRITGNRITLSGTGGTCNINIDGTNYLATFTSNLNTSAANFVTTHTAALSGLGITVSASSGVLTFTYTGTQRIITISNVSVDLYGQFTNDFEEPTMTQLADHTVLITLRSDPLQSTHMARSSDRAATWGADYFQAKSWGKNPIATNTDSSIIVTYARWPGDGDNNASRSMICVSVDGGFTWRYRLVDTGTGFYMYGGWLYDSGFVGVRGQETLNDFSSPCEIFLDEFR